MYASPFPGIEELRRIYHRSAKIKICPGIVIVEDDFGEFVIGVQSIYHQQFLEVAEGYPCAK